MRVMFASAAVVGSVLVAMVGGGCSSSKNSTSPSTTPTPQQAAAALSSSAEADLNSMVGGSPDPDVLHANDLLVAQLTADEKTHVSAIDWANATSSSLLSDSAVVKAMGILEQAGGADAAKFQRMTPGLGISSIQLATTYQCNSDCADCIDALNGAIAAGRGRVSTLSKAAPGCVIAAVANGIIGALCGGLLLYLLKRETSNLIDLEACALGGAGTLETKDFGESSSAVSDLNASCDSVADAGADAASCDSVVYYKALNDPCPNPCDVCGPGLSCAVSGGSYFCKPR